MHNLNLGPAQPGAPVMHIVSTVPLAQTRQIGERFRERWFEQLARDSAAFRWNNLKIRAEAERGADDAAASGNIRTVSSRNELARQGRLAAHPDVRSEYARLVKLRNDVFQAHPDLVRAVRHGPSQALVDIMQRQKNPRECHHVADANAYIRYLQACQRAR